jgi:uncharacterized membrane protein
MHKNEDEELKKEFQLERVVFFSDAVFAIVITIMILDVKLPEVEKNLTESQAITAFLHIIPKLIGYVVSFAVVGRFWMQHLRIFSFLKDYNFQLIVINLLFLFCVSLYPFALSFFFNSGQFTQYRWGIYTYAIIGYMTMFAQTMLTGYLIKNKEELCSHNIEIESTLRWRIKRFDYFVLPVAIVLMTYTIYFNLNIRTSMWIVFSPMVVYEVVKSRLIKRYYPDYKNDKVTLLSLFRHGKPKLITVKKNVGKSSKTTNH